MKLALSSLAGRQSIKDQNEPDCQNKKSMKYYGPPRPESKMVDETSYGDLEEPNWGIKLWICVIDKGK